MEKIFHPVSGEPVWVCSEKEKHLIDVAVANFCENELTPSKKGVNNE